MVKNSFNYVDLFTGVGGLSLGFEKEKFKNIFSIDFDKEICKTYRKNFPKNILIEKDIEKLSKKEILDLTKGKNIDVVIGGPPCQGFSIAGNIGRNFIDDSRNYLFKEFVRVVGILKPKVFVMENVARVYTHDKGKTRRQIIKLFEKLGYKVDCQILNSGDYGVPQIRKRIFFIGNRLGKENNFPEKNVKKYKTIKEAIDDLPKLLSGKTSKIPNHEAMNHTGQMLKKMSYISDGGSREEIPKNIRPKTGDIRKYIKYNSKEPSVCVTGDMRKIFHYSQNRALSVRELARIQTFPDSFIFEGNKISQQQQVGNAVPPLMAQSVAKTIKEVLNNGK
jgi:DNA (cytosine-5)-methyltransferase 1